MISLMEGAHTIGEKFMHSPYVSRCQQIVHVDILFRIHSYTFARASGLVKDSQLYQMPRPLPQAVECERTQQVNAPTQRCRMMIAQPQEHGKHEQEGSTCQYEKQHKTGISQRSYPTNITSTLLASIGTSGPLEVACQRNHIKREDEDHGGYPKDHQNHEWPSGEDEFSDAGLWISPWVRSACCSRGSCSSVAMSDFSSASESTRCCCGSITTWSRRQ